MVSFATRREMLQSEMPEPSLRRPRRDNVRATADQTRRVGTGARQGSEGFRRKLIIHDELNIDDRTQSVKNAPMIGGRGKSTRSDRGGSILSKIPSGQGSNSANLRQFHERVILTALRRLGQASKA